MKYLVLAYGSEEDWNALSKSERDALLAQDQVLRQRGDRAKRRASWAA